MLDKRQISRNSDRYIQLANDFLVLAEKELSAFVRAVQKLFSAEQARKAALYWIEELVLMDWPSGESIPDWRHATVVASARLFCQSEVQNLPVSTLIDEDIGGLDVPVNDAC